MSPVSRLESMRQEMLTVRGEGSSAAQNGEYEYFLDTDSDATLSSSLSSDDDKNDAEDSDMEINDDDFKEGDDTAIGFGVLVYDKTNELPKFTPISPTVTCSSLEDYTMLLNDPLENEFTDLMCRPVFTDTHTTFMVANPEGNPKETYKDTVDQQMSSPSATTTHNLTTNPQHNSIQAKAKKLMAKAKHNKLNLNFKKETIKKFKEFDQKLEALSKINVPKAIEEFVQAKVMLEMKKQMAKHVPNVVADFVKPCLNNIIKLYNRMYQNRSFETHETHQQLHNILMESIITLDQENLDAQDTEPTFKKRPHDDQDPPNNREGEKRRKIRKDASESSSKSSKKDKSPMDSTHDDIPADQPYDPVEEMIQKHSNPERFPNPNDKSVLMEADKGIKHNWFDMLLESNIEQDENNSLRLSTVMVSKKVKELIKKEKLTIVDLECAGLEMLKSRYAVCLRLSLGDTEDMYLLKVQGKLHHLKLEYENDFINALLLYIQRVVIKNIIEDTQLEKGVVYLNKYYVKSLMLREEVYKFCDGTLMKVQDNLQKMLNENRLGRGNKNLMGRD
ncbi:hypothetical protein Tco_0978211 [Tanacetum coccineum]|uniref:Uncharacterized protein n=1 Tax=Tanacetum coccineum TaxID=301880 RepID=A0ABQ5EMA4_9ASTR